MKFRSYLACAVGGIAAILSPLSAYAGQKPAEKFPVYQIEEAVQKWPEHWVGRLIEDDYTDGKRTKLLSFVPGKFEKNECGVKTMLMNYISEIPAITLPETIEKSIYDFIRIGISHELGHFVTIAESGLMSLPGYSGPSENQLRTLAERAMHSIPENEILIRDAIKNFDTVDLVGLANLKYESLSGIWNYATKSLNSRLEMTTKALDRIKSSHTEKLKEAEKIMVDPLPDTDLALARLMEKVEALNREFEASIGKGEYNEDINKAIYKVMTDKCAEDEMINYVKMVFGRLERMTALESGNPVNIFKKEMGKVLEDTILHHMTNKVKSCYSRATIFNNFYAREPGEFNARVIAGVADMSAGKATFNEPVPSEEQLDAFNEMKLNSQRVFGDIIDHYRFVKNLVSQGYSTKEAQAIAGPLKQNDFRIKGNPEMESFYPPRKNWW